MPSIFLLGETQVKCVNGLVPDVISHLVLKYDDKGEQLVGSVNQRNAELLSVGPLSHLISFYSHF